MKELCLAISTLIIAGCASRLDSPFLRESKEFSCTPSIVAPGETISLTKKSIEFDELAVLRPGSRAAHFLVVRDPPSDLRPLMKSEQLAASKEISIDVDSLTGLEWRTGAKQETVFTVPGTYQFMLARTLESDDVAYICEVSYQPPRAAR